MEIIQKTFDAHVPDFSKPSCLQRAKNKKKIKTNGLKSSIYRLKFWSCPCCKEVKDIRTKAFLRLDGSLVTWTSIEKEETWCKSWIVSADWIVEKSDQRRDSGPSIAGQQSWGFMRVWTIKHGFDPTCYHFKKDNAMVTIWLFKKIILIIFFNFFYSLVK